MKGRFLVFVCLCVCLFTSLFLSMSLCFHLCILAFFSVSLSPFLPLGLSSGLNLCLCFSLWPLLLQRVASMLCCYVAAVCCAVQILETPSRLYLVMELASGGELFDFIVQRQRVDEGTARRLFRQILSGVEALHSLCICHR